MAWGRLCWVSTPLFHKQGQLFLVSMTNTSQTLQETAKAERGGRPVTQHNQGGGSDGLRCQRHRWASDAQCYYESWGVLAHFLLPVLFILFFFLHCCCFEQRKIRAHTICHSHWEGKLKGCVETCWYDLRVCGRQGMWWVETFRRLWAWQGNGKCETKAPQADHNQPGVQWCAASSWAFISRLKMESAADVWHRILISSSEFQHSC